MKIFYGLKSVIESENKTELRNCLEYISPKYQGLKHTIDALLCMLESCDLSPHIICYQSII